MMIPLLAETPSARDILSLFGMIGGVITTLAAALLGAYALWRKTRTTANSADNEAQTKAKLDAVEVEAKRKELDAKIKQDESNIEVAVAHSAVADLRVDNNNLRQMITSLQNTTLQRIIEAHEERNECEKRYAVL